MRRRRCGVTARRKSYSCAETLRGVFPPRTPFGVDLLCEAARVLHPGGVFVHGGVHPCFCGGLADRSDPNAVVIRPGYLDSNWTTDSRTDQGVRDKVGARHWPLPNLRHALIDAGLMPERYSKVGPRSNRPRGPRPKELKPNLAIA